MQKPCTPPAMPIEARKDVVSHSVASASVQIRAACQVIANGRIVARQLATQAKSCGVTEAEFRLLWQLQSTNPELPDQKALGEQLGLSPAQVSSVVERLRKEGLVEGQAAPGDRRRQVWRLTPDGQQLLQNFVTRWASQSRNENITSPVCKEEAA